VLRRACSIPILLAACSGASAPTVPATDAYPSPASGARLRAQYLQAEDGSRTFAAWFDTARGETCRFALADDGELRCLPLRAGAVDRTCVEPAVTYRQGAVCQPRYAADSSGRGVYQLDPSALPGMVTVGTCNLGGPDQVTYRAKRVLPGEFVRARRARRSSDPGQRLVPFDLVADDGTVEPRGFYDVNLSLDCAPAIAADGKRRCLPLADPCLRGDGYSDAACSRAVSNVPVGCTVPASVIFVRGGHPLASLPFACPDDATEIFRLGGDAPAGGPFRVDGAGKCGVGDVVSGPRKALTPVDPGTFAVFPAPAAGSVRLRDPLAGLQCPVGCALDTTFEDTTLGLPCRFTASPEGGLRCLPPSRVTTYYADAACTVPVVGAEALSPQRCLGAAGRQLSPAQAAVAGDVCAPVAQAVTLGAAFSGAVYQSAAGGCQGAVGISAVFQIGGELEMSRFVGGKLVTE
jgi:hypothetical protein